ncbi:MAG: class I SAM-dependent methyltransferase [Synechococcales cyanobacterium C42_A2020_086]|jgi:SAM-dependent methyltransferase|nr:class I SAM-dependent methyltransferase [Synechococcales cyanobacterium C42_A2020_086]
MTDWFSTGSADYAAVRPRYPRRLYDTLASYLSQRQRVWDCGCGNGQAAVDLVDYFAEVQATDVSAEQIRHAIPADRVSYSVQPAEATTFPDAYFDAVTVAQALHWFDRERFWAEVERVLRPGGVFAAWGYDWFAIAPAIDAVVQRQISEVLAPYWSPRLKLMWDGYRDAGLPFAPLPGPELQMTVDWTLPELLAYLQTWSATKRCLQEQGSAWLHTASRELVEAWGAPDQPRTVTMKIHWIAGQKGNPK